MSNNSNVANEDDTMSNNSSSGKYTKGKKILSVISNGIKKTMSPNYDSDIYAINRIKARGYDLYSNLRDFFYVILMMLSIVYYYIVSVFKLLRMSPYVFSMAAKNNFRIGINMLEKNNLVDAKIRFLLSNMFYNKSATTNC